LEDWVYQYDYGYEGLSNHFGTASLKGFGIEDIEEGIVAAGAVLYYLKETEHREISHISSISRIEEDHYVWLDKFTIRNLELLHAQQDGIPLIQILDQTVTPMGSRLMKKWMVLPLKDKSAIEERHKAVEALLGNQELLDNLLQHLKQIGDVERLISKVAVSRINPREMVQLKRALALTTPIKTYLSASGIAQLQKMADQLNPCQFLLDKIDKELKEDPPMLVHQGNLIREGVDEELDDLRRIAYSGKDYLLQVQQREVERTGISSLKIAYNKVFGYYLEVTNAHKDKVPNTWLRKQTLVNAERYITEELKTYEEQILGAEEKILALEARIYQELMAEVAQHILPIQENAVQLAQLDVLLNFAVIAQKNRYVRPQLDNGQIIDIKGGRHPVIEKQMPPGEDYITNDLFLDSDSQQIMIIT